MWEHDEKDIERIPDPHNMAETIEDELLAEEGQEHGLDPDLALFMAREELEEEEE
jgi:hypothetical protein